MFFGKTFTNAAVTFDKIKMLKIEELASLGVEIFHQLVNACKVAQINGERSRLIADYRAFAVFTASQSL